MLLLAERQNLQSEVRAVVAALIRRMGIRLREARRLTQRTAVRPAVRILLAGITALLLMSAAVGYGLALWKVPDVMDLTDEKDRHNARFLIVSVGGAVVVAIGLLYTARTYRLSHRGQVTDRFTKALERLSSDDIDVCLGGVYALAHVARDSRAHHDEVVEVLETFIRRRAAPASPSPPRRFPAFPTPGTDRVSPRRPEADVQAALTAIGRRPCRPEHRTLDLAELQLTGSYLANVDLKGANLYRVDLTDADLPGANMIRAQLQWAELGRADLSNAYMAGAKMFSAKLEEAILNDANLTKAILDGAKLYRANMIRSRLVRAYLRGARLVDARMIKANLTDANLEGANLTGAKLLRARLVNANLHDATLVAAELTDAKLSMADLSNADLSRVDLIRARLIGADLGGADLISADLTEANLMGANLSGADLTDSILKGADLTNADLTRAKLIRANLAGANLAGAVLKGASLADAALAGTKGIDLDGGSKPNADGMETGT
ncbi:pentapeptide repeat-containing protein [Nonomuraea basaltis]|uniref:pentapeptide repeat-containing protein n=1 Tax=Nonomuraea basaltis TaxID=2495887 RepID=UPI001485D21A|nr:pentapeptide repeat-containing protein [Nonomuraea basaltis]